MATLWGFYEAPCPPYSRRGRRPPRAFPIDDRGREDGARTGPARRPGQNLWCVRAESNSRLPPSESGTLSTELRTHVEIAAGIPPAWPLCRARCRLCIAAPSPADCTFAVAISQGNAVNCSMPLQRLLVGVTGFEPVASCVQSRPSTGLTLHPAGALGGTRTHTSFDNGF